MRSAWAGDKSTFYLHWHCDEGEPGFSDGAMLEMIAEMTMAMARVGDTVTMSILPCFFNVAGL